MACDHQPGDHGREQRQRHPVHRQLPLGRHERREDQRLMAKAGYSIVTGAAVALSAATAKSVLGVRGNAAFGIDLKKFSVAFDGTSATATPVLVEICYATFATNAPGTNSTSVTPTQNYGRTIAH